MQETPSDMESTSTAPLQNEATLDFIREDMFYNDLLSEKVRRHLKYVSSGHYFSKQLYYLQEAGWTELDLIGAINRTLKLI